jgi:hypothetical protein
MRVVAADAPASPPAVTVSEPIQRELIEWDEYTGQFAAKEYVEIRARVSGYLTEIPLSRTQCRFYPDHGAGDWPHQHSSGQRWQSRQRRRRCDNLGDDHDRQTSGEVPSASSNLPAAVARW